MPNENYFDIDDYISHHGILGQKWGSKNGPPYPISIGGHSSTQKKAAKAAGISVGKDSGKGSIVKLNNKKSPTPIEKARATKAANRQKKLEAEEHEKQRKAALASGDLNQVKKYAKESSAQELQDAINKANLMSAINKATAPKTVMKRIDSAMTALDTVNKWGTTGINTWNTVAKIYNSTHPGEKPLTVIGGGGGNKNDKKNN